MSQEQGTGEISLSLGHLCWQRVVYGGRRLPKLGRKDGFTDRAKFKALGEVELALDRQRDRSKVDEKTAKAAKVRELAEDKPSAY